MDEETKKKQHLGLSETDSASPENSAPTDERDQQIQELQARVDELQRSVDSLRDQLLRKAAEFENYKRRAENDFAGLVRSANEALITALLPILNDFLRSLAQLKKEKGSAGITKGVELIYTKLLRVLEQQGLTPFDSLGKPFDVEYHDALLQVPRSDVPPHTVVEEVERGYKLHDKVLRHAKVVVSAAPHDAVEPVPGKGEHKSGKGN
jgi:molecular chaperone GrpE